MSCLCYTAHQHQHIILEYGAGPGGLRSVAAALEQGASGNEALLVRVAAGVYRERLMISRPVVVEAHPPVRHFLPWRWCYPPRAVAFSSVWAGSPYMGREPICFWLRLVSTVYICHWDLPHP